MFKYVVKPNLDSRPNWDLPLAQIKDKKSTD